MAIMKNNKLESILKNCKLGPVALFRTVTGFKTIKLYGSNEVDNLDKLDKIMRTFGAQCIGIYCINDNFSEEDVAEAILADSEE